MDLFGTISANISKFILIGLLAFFLLYFIFGLIGGAKKQVYRWITSIIFFVILVIGIDKGLENALSANVGPILQSVGVNVSGTTGEEVINNFISPYVGKLDESILKIGIGLCGCFIKFIGYTVVAIFLYIPYWLITQIIYWIFFAKRKRITDKRTGKTKKAPKHGAVGGLLSGIKGAALYCLFIVIVINGPISMIPGSMLGEEETSEKQEVAQSIDTQIMNNETVQGVLEVISAYKQSSFYQLSTKEVGEKKQSINSVVNDRIWTFKFDNETSIDVRNEISNLLGLVKPALKVYYGLTATDKTIEFDSMSSIVAALSNSEILTNLLPIAVGAVTQIDSVKQALEQYNISITSQDIKDINFKQDLVTLSDCLLEVKNVYNSISYVESANNVKNFTTINLEALDFDSVKKVVNLLTNLTLLNKTMDIAAKYVLSLDSVKQLTKGLEDEISDIVWIEELSSLENIIEKVVDLGIKSVSYVQNELTSFINGIDFGNEESDGKVGALISAIFSDKVVEQLLPKLLRNVVNEKVDEQYRSLFNFDNIDQKGWENEFLDLVRIFKDLKGNDKLIGDDGKLDLNLVKNIKPTTLLNSEIVSNALISVLADAARGEGALASLANTIKIPYVYSDKDFAGDATHSAWKVSAIRYYVASASVETETEKYEKFDTIEVSTYNTLSDSNKESFKPVYNIVDGEVYKLLNAITEIADVVDITGLYTGQSASILSKDTLEKLVKEEDGKCKVEKVCESIIIRTTLSSFISEAGDTIVVPPSVTQTEAVCKSESNEKANVSASLVETEDIKVIDTDEIVRVFKAIVKLDIIGDEGIELDNLMSSEFFGKLLEECDDDHNTRLDYALDSVILEATISKLLLDMDDSIVIPNSVVENVAADDETKVINKDELKTLVSAVNALDLISGDNVSVSNDLIGQMLYLTDDNYTRLDYILGSDDNKIKCSQILLATVSDKINDIDLVVVPSTAYGDSITVYNKQDSFSLIKATELKNLISVISKLDVLGGDGLDAGLGFVSKLSTYYAYKPEESLTPHTDDTLIIDQLVNSDIALATFSKQLIDNAGESLKVVKYAKSTLGDTEVISKSEFADLIKSINNIGIIASYKNNGSAVCYYVKNDCSIIGLDEYNLLTSEQQKAYTRIDVANNDMVSENVYKAVFENNNDFIKVDATVSEITKLASSILGVPAYQTQIANSTILRATVSDTVINTLFDGKEKPVDALNYVAKNNSLVLVEYKDIDDSSMSEYELAEDGSYILSRSEIIALFNSLNLLGINNFDNIDVNMGLIFKLYNNSKFIDVLDSSCIWETISNSILDSKTGDNPLFASVSSTDCIKKKANSDSTSYIPFTATKAGFDEEVTISAYDAKMTDRLSKSELNGIVGSLELFFEDPENATDFAIDSSVLTNIYKDATLSRNFSDSVGNSVVLTYSVSNMLKYAIDDALEGTMFASAGSTIKNNIEFLQSVDSSLWQDFDETIDEYNYSTAKGLSDDQMYKMLIALNSISSISDISDLDESSIRVIDGSFTLRPVLDSVCYYDGLTPVYYNHEASQSERSTWIANFVAFMSI